MEKWRQLIDTAKQNGEWERIKATARKIDSELKADPLKYNSLFLINRVEALAGKDATLWDFERALIQGMNDSQKTVLLEITTECKTIIQKSQTGSISGSNIMAINYLNCIETYYPDLLTERTEAQTKQLKIPAAALQALQEKGFIENAAARPLKWLGKSKALLAYFVDVANEKLKLKDSGGRRQIKPFETLFNETGLQNCINEYKNKTGQLPQGYTDIDKIFSNLKY
jgi:hypothetical protein